MENYPYFERGKDSTMAYLYRLFQEKIVMFDGAMGTMIQKYKLGEEEYRGERFKVGLCAGGYRHCRRRRAAQSLTDPPASCVFLRLHCRVRTGYDTRYSIGRRATVKGDFY